MYERDRATAGSESEGPTAKENISEIPERYLYHHFFCTFFLNFFTRGIFSSHTTGFRNEFYFLPELCGT